MEKTIDIEKMKNDPRYIVLHSLLDEAAKDFIMLFKQAHDALGAVPHEFVNGAVIQNKETGAKSIFDLTLTVRNDVTEEEFNRYVEESKSKEEALSKKWGKEEK